MRIDLVESNRPVRTAERKPVGATRLLIVAADASNFATHRLSLACAARDAGYDVHVAAPLGRTREDEEARQTLGAFGLALHVIPPLAARGGWQALSRLRTLGALLDELRPDLIHGIGTKATFFAGAAARLHGIPAVHTLGGLGGAAADNSFATAVRRNLLVSALALGHSKACYIVQSADDRAAFLRTAGFDSRRTFLLRGIGTDLQEFRPRAPAERTASAPVVMYASRLAAALGVRDFVQAARALRAKGLVARFVLVGPRDLADPSCIGEGELLRWQEEGAIEYWDYPQDRAATLRQADIFCLPAQSRESVPRALIEAAAVGLPIVTTNISGCREAVRHGANGFLVPPRDGHAIEAAVERLIVDTELRCAAGARSREIAVAEFSLDAFLTASLAVYRAVLGERAGEINA